MAKKNSKKTDKYKNIIGIVIILAFLALLFFLLNFLFSGIGKVNYDGLSFDKTEFGTIPIFTHPYQLYSTLKNETITYNFYVRIDPTQNNVSFVGNTILYPSQGSNVYLGLDDQDFAKCNNSDSVLGPIELAQFISVNQFNLTVGDNNATESDLTNQTYISCNNYPNNMVVMFIASNTTEIDEVNQNCYVIQENNCNLLAPAEKFELDSVVDAINNSQAQATVQQPQVNAAPMIISNSSY